MKRIVGLLRRIVPALLVVAVTLTTAAPVASQVSDVEPNNTCGTAQDIGSATLPFTLNGSLDTPPGIPDVDFFKFTGPPSTTVQLDLEGVVTGKGTLADPLLGVFDPACSFITSDDNSGTPPNARVQFVVPPSGVFVVAATSCCDYGFAGAGLSSGSYQLTISALQAIGSISGRVVDAVTGNPLPGIAPPFASVELRRCVNGDCFQTVGFQAPDEQGRFRFENGFGQILTPGTYQLFVSAGPTYQPVLTPPFAVDEGQDYDSGDIALSPVPSIGSISGRVVDAATGAPLRGDVPPFAFVRLLRCDDFGCFDLNAQPTDNQGRFRFQTDYFGLPLPAGTYQLVIAADQYRERTTAPFTVGENENLDLGDIGLTARPIRFSEIRPCGQLPPEGGTCEYSFRITNSQTTTLSGLVWTIVEASSSGTFSDTIRFQPGLPTWYLLPPGASRVVRFDFEVPSSTPNGTYICVQGTASQGDTFFDVVGQKSLFCIVKGYTGFRLLSEKEARALLRGDRASPRSLAAPKR
ncbi:MAG TPA: carboxypeptidase-like regulatory domain-containing protein [Roseiflexaceae bacterium]